MLTTDERGTERLKVPARFAVVFVADALGAWLVGQLADAGWKKLTELMLGSEQERALRRAADAQRIEQRFKPCSPKRQTESEQPRRHPTA